METGQLTQPVRGNLARHERIFIVALVAILMLGLASPAQAGLGDLIDGLLGPVEQLPVLGGIVDPIVGGLDPVVEPIVSGLDPVVDPIVGGILDPVVDPIVGGLDPVVDPTVENLTAPAVENVVAPIVEPVVEEVLPPVDEVVPPVVGGVVPPIDQIEVAPVVGGVAIPPVESVTAPGTSSRDEFPTITTSLTSLNGPPRENLPNGSTRIPGRGDRASLVLARALQTALVDTTGTPPTVAGLVDSTGTGWLLGLTDWLHGTANGLGDLLSIPLRLLEILVRALLTAGSGLVAPASLALAFTIYAVRDRRWQGLRKTAFN